jgi:hypothetical protein
MSTMPCDARRLLKQRLRGHGDEVVRQALRAWDDERFVLAPPQPAAGPVDARLFLTDWPYVSLLDTAEQPPVISGSPVPLPQSPTVRALAELFDIDPLGFVLVVSALRGSLDVGRFRAALGRSSSEVMHSYVIALFRLLALSSNAALAIADEVSRQCVIARYFRPGTDSEIAALHAAQSALPEAKLNMVTFREALRSGTAETLRILRQDPRIAVVWADATNAIFSTILGLDSAAVDLTPGFDEPLLSLLNQATDLGEVPNSEGHPSLSLLIAMEPTAEGRERTVAHLLACADERCLRTLGGEVCGRDSSRRFLAHPASEQVGSPDNGTPRLILCRDVVWEAFSTMAQAEGREVDELVDEAMERYRLLRQRLREPAKPDSVQPITEIDFDAAAAALERRVAQASEPPPSARNGLRIPAANQLESATPVVTVDPTGFEADEPTRPVLALPNDEEQTRPR